MSRPQIRRLCVSGIGKANAEIDFGPRLTLITGLSDTGKTHILECIDYALGSGSPPRELPEGKGYDLVALEIGKDSDIYVISRRFSDGDNARIFTGTLADWDEESAISTKVHIGAVKDSLQTLSGWLLALCGFDVNARVIKNQKGESQSLSFRTVSPLLIVDENAIISTASPVLPEKGVRQTADRSVFRIVLTGEAPSAAGLAALKEANRQRAAASLRLAVLDPIIEDLRNKIAKSELDRREVEDDLARIDSELADVSETVSKSGERLRVVMSERNRSLSESDAASRKSLAAQELQARFSLLAKHYRADMLRLQFVLEGGHFL